MRLRTFIRRTRMTGSAENAFRWHTRAGAFSRLTPPWERVRLIEHTGGVRDGARVVIEIGVGPLCLRWVARHEGYVEGRQFCDVQESGPFRAWRHTHRFEPDGVEAFWMEDQVDYALPLGGLGRLLGGRATHTKLERMFRHRHEQLAHDLAVHQTWNGPPMNVLVTGASGLIGSALTPFLTTGGHRGVPLKRASATTDAVPGWDPAAGRIDLSAGGPFDAVVHLAGATIGQRWNGAKKQCIRESRVDGTRLLCEALVKLPRPPKTLVCASATGIYGDRGDEWLDETSAVGSGFLAGISKEWEAAASPAVEHGIRVVNLRFGIVLARNGGALPKMLPAFKLGLGGRLGGGESYWSWIALDDVLGVIHHALANESLRGPVNVVSPNPVTNAEFTATLGRVLHRPTIFPVPRLALELLFGEMAREALLASARVRPAKLLASGFQFHYPGLEAALKHALGK